jgi:hypothetical protein
LSKPGNNLLRLAAAQSQAGSLTLFEDAGARSKTGLKENSPTPQLFSFKKEKPFPAGNGLVENLMRIFSTCSLRWNYPDQVPRV